MTPEWLQVEGHEKQTSLPPERGLFLPCTLQVFPEITLFLNLSIT